MKKIMFMGFLFPALIFANSSGMKNTVESGIAVEFSAVNQSDDTPSDSIPPDSTQMRNMNSVELSMEMIPGWNVGNSLEAIGSETAWGNPFVTQTLMDSIKAAGFNAVRIPVSWSRFSVDSTYTIQTSWLERVEEVVNYVLNSGMYAIINEHWDGGWMQPTNAEKEEVTKRFTAMWKQIAIHFRDYGDSLLFAGTNEVHVENDWGTPKRENLNVQNGYNQTFVNTVRATGGRNYYRHLVVQGYRTNIDLAVKYMVVPEDVLFDRLMVEVHYYDPYNFAQNGNSNITQWGKYATDPSKTETWANESYADNEFNRMKTQFIDKGYGVILGEYGAVSRTNLGSDALNEEHADYRKYYILYITESMINHGLVPFYWDDGYIGNHGYGIFNRYTNTIVYPDILDAIMGNADTTIVGIDESLLKSKSCKIHLDQNYPNPFNPATQIRYHLSESGNVNLEIFSITGEKISTLLDEEQQAGYHSIFWNTNEEQNEIIASGVYLYKLTFKTKKSRYTDSKRMILIK